MSMSITFYLYITSKTCVNQPRLLKVFTTVMHQINTPYFGYKSEQIDL